MSYVCSGKREALAAAVIEAERFLLLAKHALAAIDELDKSKCIRASSKEVASAKRASMDLTRKLVAVRS